MEKTSYAIGMNVAASLLRSGAKDIDCDALCRGIKDVLSGQPTEISPNEAGQILKKYFSDQEDAQTKDAIRIGVDFLAANGKRSEVTTLKSGLQYEVLKQGDGPKPKATDTVRCHYVGTLIDGTEFDSSIRRGAPADFPVNGVIAGWVEALQLMPVGSKWKLYIPYQLGYGARGAGRSIPPYAALIFEVELLEILK